MAVTFDQVLTCCSLEPYSAATATLSIVLHMDNKVSAGFATDLIFRNAKLILVMVY